MHIRGWKGAEEHIFAIQYWLDTDFRALFGFWHSGVGITDYLFRHPFLGADNREATNTAADLA